MIPDTPIACNLPPGVLRDRTAWIGSLNRASLRAVERRPHGVTLTYDAGAEADLRESVRLESTCCAFLALRLAPAPGGGMTLSVEAPALDGAEHLLAPFRSESEVSR